MTTIYLVRHGEYENPRQINPVRLKGFPLSNEGIVQMERNANYFRNKNIKIIYSSPILRTKQSAQILKRLLKIPLRFSKSIIEVSSPIQGKSFLVLKEIEKYGDSFKLPYHLQKKGETVEHVYRRMKRLLKKILIKYQNKNVIIVSHGDPIMVLALIESGNPIDKQHAIHSYLSVLPYVPKGGIIKIEYNKTIFNSMEHINF